VLPLIVFAAGTLPSASVADDVLLDLTGNTWERGLYAVRVSRPLGDEDPPPAPSPRDDDSGRSLSAVGMLTSVSDPLVWNPFAFSVSWSLKDLELVHEVREGPTRISEYAGGRLTLFSDAPSEVPMYGTHPPNATSPAEFEDGYSTYLDGVLTNVRLTFDATSGLGTLDGDVHFVGGAMLTLLPDPSGWVLAVTLQSGSPIGYSFQMQGSVFRNDGTTAREARSWASSKARFR
jgi:hypothetical protein